MKKDSKKNSYPKTEFHTVFRNDKRMMICMNSVPNGKYWKGNFCENYSSVSDNAISILCCRCTNALTDPPAVKTPIASDKPKGWKFMKEFVTQDGTVYFKGVEQPELKGTRKPTVIEPKPEKKKLTKQEKEVAVQDLGKQIESFKAELFKETRKNKRKEITKALSKANRELKKLL